MNQPGKARHRPSRQRKAHHASHARPTRGSRLRGAREVRDPLATRMSDIRFGIVVGWALAMLTIAFLTDVLGWTLS